MHLNEAKALWEAEDKTTLVWEHAGFTCCVKNSPKTGHWCGYVNVKQTHPWATYGDNFDAEVHGGVTWSQENLPAHSAVDGEWWVGFDCSHYQDIRPLDPFADEGTYWTRSMVIMEAEALAEQAKKHAACIRIIRTLGTHSTGTE